MSTPIEDYAVIGDTETAALVARDRSIDWLCLPRFDSGSCLAALLGDQGNGRWRIAPAGGAQQERRKCRSGTLILETDMDAEGGTVGLLSEEYDPVAKRMLGNFPQAFSHLSLIDSAYDLSAEDREPAKNRAADS